MNVVQPRRQPSAENMNDSRYANERRFSLKVEIAKYVVSATIVAIGAGVLLYLKSLATNPQTQTSTALIQQVDTFQVQPYSGVLDRVVTGTVVPHREIKLAAEVGGRIKEKFGACEAGTFVTRGEPLVKVDPEEYELEIATLKADVQQAERRIEENQQQIAGEKQNIQLAQADLEIQQREYARNQRLQGVLSQSELDQAKRALNSAKTQLQTRQNNLATLEAADARLQAALEFSKRRLEKADLNLRRTLITAPDDGIIVQENVQEGDFVAPGTQIVTFEDTSQAEVLCNLTPGDLEWIRSHSNSDDQSVENSPLSVYRIPPTAVTIFDPANPAVTWSGVLERFDGIGRDATTKTIPARIVVTEPIVKTRSGLQALVRGMYVKCRIEVQKTAAENDMELVAFPGVALHPNNVVWTVENRKLNRVSIQVVDRAEQLDASENHELIIASSAEGQLKPGDSIVVSPLSQPTDGAPVILRNGFDYDSDDRESSSDSAE